jgi:hypothetical protein
LPGNLNSRRLAAGLLLRAGVTILLFSLAFNAEKTKFMKDRRSLLFVSNGSHWSKLAHDFIRDRFADVDWMTWDYGQQPRPDFAGWPGADLLLSFSSDVILPESALSRVRELAVNFHPSIPEYRGIGGCRYAIDEGRSRFGVTCHFITPELDSGPIIAVDRFEIIPGESEASLTERTAAVALTQLQRIVAMMHGGITLQADHHEQWGSRLYTRRGLEVYKKNNFMNLVLARGRQSPGQGRPA